MVTRGVYGWVRHPIYAGITLLMLGLGILSGNLGRIAVSIVSFVFFDRKAALEEAWLTERFAEYGTYRQQVRWRLLPGLR